MPLISMPESVHGRQLARLIAVFISVVLWSGLGAARGPGLAQAQAASQPTVRCADAGEHGQSEISAFAGGDLLKEGKEGKEGETSEESKPDDDGDDSLVAPLASAVPPELLACVPTRMIRFPRARPRLSAGYDVLARERGPPVV